MKTAKKPSFEERYTRLEQVVALLDAGDLPLDETLALFEEGIALAASCEQELDNAELQVSQLLVAANDEPEPPDQLF